jgi:hypothetical protein
MEYVSKIGINRVVRSILIVVFLYATGCDTEAASDQLEIEFASRIVGKVTQYDMDKNYKPYQIYKIDVYAESDEYRKLIRVDDKGVVMDSLGAGVHRLEKCENGECEYIRDENDDIYTVNIEKGENYLINLEIVSRYVDKNLVEARPDIFSDKCIIANVKGVENDAGELDKVKFRMTGFSDATTYICDGDCNEEEMNYIISQYIWHVEYRMNDGSVIRMAFETNSEGIVNLDNILNGYYRIIALGSIDVIRRHLGKVKIPRGDDPKFRELIRIMLGPNYSISDDGTNYGDVSLSIRGPNVSI